MSSSAPSSGPPPPPPTPTIPSPSYEPYAPRTESQRARLARIAILTSGPTSSGTSTSASTGTTSSGGTPSTQQSHSHPSLLLTAMSPPPLSAHLSPSTPAEIQNTLLASQQTINHLSHILKHSTSLSSSLSKSLQLSSALSQRHSHLLHQSSELSSAAERLQVEETILSRHAEEIGAPLSHYDAIDRIGVQVGVLFKEDGKITVHGLAKIKVDSDQYIPTLDQIDSAYQFFPPESEYHRRAGILQEAALDLIKEALVEKIKDVTQQIHDALELSKKTIQADKLEASLAYTKFHGISSRSRSLIDILQKRQGEKYREMLLLTRNTYCFSREKLLKMSIRSHMEKLRNEHGLVGMTRLASVFLMKVCTLETEMYLDFFGRGQLAKQEQEENLEDKTAEDVIELTAKAKTKKKNQAMFTAQRIAAEDEIFQGMLSTLCSALYRTVRRGLVMVNDLDTLCQIVSVLREERSHANATRTTVAASRAISGVVKDAQERLIFCANNALQKDVIRFKPKPEDLDYPNKLSKENQDGKDAVQAQMQIYEAWFPSMRSVLRILSKIFRVVEPRVFEDIAQQSVQACTKSLKEAAMNILMKNGVIHGDLFLVKHLLILREQLSPFDIQLRSIERQLDFSEASKAVTRFLANRNRRLFSMSTENALVTLLREGVSVQESSVDSKRDLEDALRSACNDFIEHTFARLVRSLLGFIEDCKGVTTAEGDLKQEEFMRGDIVRDVMKRTLDRLEPEIEAVTKDMGVYLENVATQSILLKPVIKKILRALEEARKFIGEVTEDGDAEGWDNGCKGEVENLMKEIEVIVKGSGSRLAAR